MAVFLFFGDDLYSLREKLTFWKSEFQKKHGGDMNIAALEGIETSANEIFSVSSSLPFLGEKRLTIVKDFLAEAEIEEQTSLSGMLEKIPEFCTLVFVERAAPDRRTSLFKKIQKIGKLTEFSPATGSKLLAWIEKKVSERNASIEKDAVILLSEFTNGDLFRLENDIAKLAGFAHDRAITKNDVEELVNTQLETSIFRLTDAIGQKNIKTSLGTLHALIESGEDLFGILHMIMRQLRIITMVKDLSTQGLRSSEITLKLKEHPFAISNSINQAKNFTMEQLKRAYKLLIDLDLKLKSGGVKILAGDNREFVLALDRLVLDLCC